MIEDGALALRASMDAGQISVQDLMAETLARVSRCNDRVNAIVSLRDPDILMAEARAADQAAAAGWLHGIPIAIKDLDDARGLPSTQGGVPAHAATVATEDALFVARLRAAGAIIIGKTNAPEFGLGSHTVNRVFGATRNPYDTNLSAGGSSGGAAVALATRMLSIADGSDMMGSLRNPAGWNNVYGMRPSWGLVPPNPQGEAFFKMLATHGPMARSPRDLAALLDTMAGRDALVPHGLDQAPSLPQIDQGISHMRIGWLADWGGALPTEPGVLDICEEALSRFQELGHKVDPFAAPFDREVLWSAWTTLRSFALAGSLGALYADARTRAGLNPQSVWEIERGLNLSAMQVHRASEMRSDWFRTAAILFDTCDVLALPSAQMWPFDITLDWPRSIGATSMDSYHRWMEVVIPASLIGLPAISVPAGFGGAKDMPMGLQLIGRHGSDAKLLNLAEHWHQATQWPAQRAPDLIHRL